MSVEICSAILEQQGVLGEALLCALAIENAEWNNMRFAALTHNDIVAVFRDAIQWTNGIINSL